MQSGRRRGRLAFVSSRTSSARKARARPSVAARLLKRPGSSARACASCVSIATRARPTRPGNGSGEATSWSSIPRRRSRVRGSVPPPRSSWESSLPSSRRSPVRANRVDVTPIPRLRRTRDMRGLYAIVDAGALDVRGLDPLAFAEAVLSVSPAALQLRAKNVSARETLALLRALAPMCHRSGVLLVANDRPDLALMAGCDLVHVGQDDMPIERVRRIAPGLGVGISTHTLEQ